MKKNQGKKAFIAVKVDLEKAYDRMDWEFLKRIMFELQIPEAWLNLIMNSVSTPVLSLLWNGEKTESFQPTWRAPTRWPGWRIINLLSVNQLCVDNNCFLEFTTQGFFKDIQTKATLLKCDTTGSFYPIHPS